MRCSLARWLITAWSSSALLACGGSEAPHEVSATLLPRISAGASHTCFVMFDGQVACWGSNVDGQLGDGDTEDRSVPVRVLGVEHAIAVSAGSYHACALLRSGEERCWGWNSFGQLGVEKTIAQTEAAPVPGLPPAIGIANGGYHSCALLADGSGRCWGQNDVGQLGNGGQLDRVSPSPVFALPEAALIGSGGRHTCVVVRDGFNDGSIQCWGSNDSGELGNGTTEAGSFPSLVVGIRAARAVSVGFNHSCALQEDGSVYCWGANDQGQLGDAGESGANSAFPVLVTGLRATALGAGYNHTCAVLAEDRSIVCWGANSGGQLGDGTTEDRKSPGAVPGVVDGVGVAGGSFHTCVQCRDGKIECWGANDAGQLGDGTTASRFLPGAIAE